jgi:hypothetical protein
MTYYKLTAGNLTCINGWLFVHLPNGAFYRAI